MASKGMIKIQIYILIAFAFESIISCSGKEESKPLVYFFYLPTTNDDRLFVP